MFSRKIRLVAIRSCFYTMDFYKVWHQNIYCQENTGLCQSIDLVYAFWKLVFNSKEMSFCLNPYISAIGRCNPLIFQTWIILSNIIHSLKYLRFTTSGCKDIANRKSEFVTKTQFFCVFANLGTTVSPYNSRLKNNPPSQGLLMLHHR